MTEKCRWPAEVVYAKLAEQNSLLPNYEEQLATRVGADTISLIKTGAQRLDESWSTQIGSRSARGRLTQSQKQSLRKTLDFFTGCRKAISTEYRKDKATRDAFGLNVEMKGTSVHSVTHSIDLFVKGAEDYPEKALAAAVSAEDVEKLKQLRAEVAKSELSQEGQKNLSKGKTASRQELQGQIEAAMIKLVNAAALVFSDEPKVVQLFKGTLPSSHKRSAKGEEGEDSTTDSTSTPSTETKTDPK